MPQNRAPSRNWVRNRVASSPVRNESASVSTGWARRLRQYTMAPCPIRGVRAADARSSSSKTASRMPPISPTVTCDSSSQWNTQASSGSVELAAR